MTTFKVKENINTFRVCESPKVDLVFGDTDLGATIRYNDTGTYMLIIGKHDELSAAIESGRQFIYKSEGQEPDWHIGRRELLIGKFGTIRKATQAIGISRHKLGRTISGKRPLYCNEQKKILRMLRSLGLTGCQTLEVFYKEYPPSLPDNRPVRHVDLTKADLSNPKFANLFYFVQDGVKYVNTGYNKTSRFGIVYDDAFIGTDFPELASSRQPFFEQSGGATEV